MDRRFKPIRYPKAAERKAGAVGIEIAEACAMILGAKFPEIQPALKATAVTSSSFSNFTKPGI